MRRALVLAASLCMSGCATARAHLEVRLLPGERTVIAHNTEDREITIWVTIPARSTAVVQVVPGRAGPH